MPFEELPEMRFPAAAVVPPIVLLLAPMIKMPPPALPKARVPVISVPM
jgi:hypothetical protein